MKILVDKISSVTRNVPLKKEVEIGNKIISAEGYVLVVEVLAEKKLYNQLELTSGRLSTLHKGDIVIVALGERRALKGFAGKIPEKLKTGDIINILNLGGVSGICISENFHDVGHALKVKVVGAVIGKDKNPLSIKDYRLFEPANKIKGKVPLILVSGTCMNVGKTSTACEIIKIAARSGLKICSAKVAGIAALKDTLMMEDHGSRKVVSIIDAGYTSTAANRDHAITIAKGAINYLSGEKPDYIVMELGDGILGEYGVLDILREPEMKDHISAHIGCAHDPPGAMKLHDICKEAGLRLDMISGPVTDNSVGTEFLSRMLGIQTINSLSNGEKIFPYLLKTCLRPTANALK